MQISQRFDDLEEFMTSLRGRLSREGMQMPTNTYYQEGTALAIELGLEDGPTLVRGTAGVVQVIKGPSESHSWLAVLEFLQLDPDSEAFLNRMTERLEGEGVKPFRVDDVIERGRRWATAERQPAIADDSIDELTLPESKREPALSARVGAATPSRRRTFVLLLLLLVIASVAVFARLRPDILQPLMTMLEDRLGSSRPEEVPTRPPVAGATAVPTAAKSVVLTPPAPSPLPIATTPPSIPAPAGTATRIERIDWYLVGDTTEIVVEADGDLDAAYVRQFRIKDPSPRVVLYLYGLQSDDPSYRTEVEGPHLRAIRTWYHLDKTPPQLHVVLDLASEEVDALAVRVEGHLAVVTLVSPR